MGHETHLNMTNFIIRKQCEMEDLVKIQNNINQATENLGLIFSETHDLEQSGLKIYFE